MTSLVQPDGKILVGGDFSGASSIGGQARNNLARLDPITGMADAFDPGVNQAYGFCSRATTGRQGFSGW